MARAVLMIEGEQVKERGLRVPKRIEKIEAWSKAAVKCFARELGSTPMILVNYTVTSDEIRMVYANLYGILINRNASPLG